MDNSMDVEKANNLYSQLECIAK